MATSEGGAHISSNFGGLSLRQLDVIHSEMCSIHSNAWRLTERIFHVDGPNIALSRNMEKEQ